MTNAEIKLLKNFITWQSLSFVDNRFTDEDEIITKFDKWLSVGSNDRMTNEEAGEILEYMKSNLDDSQMLARQDEALSTAIKALEQTGHKGKWIGLESLDGSIRYMCDNCKEFEYVNYYDFCPNCGADMRGDTE